METYQQIILTNAQIFVREIFAKRIDDYFVFHNINHTTEVANAANKIAKNYVLINEDELALMLAAWFHDTGFSTHVIKDHEAQSKRIAKSFLETNVDENVAIKVLNCIQATQMPQKPSNLIEEIVCDADLYHLGTDKFFEYSKRLKQEQEQYFNQQIPDEEWRQRDINFLKSHKYFTTYCRQHLEPVKQAWLQKLLTK